MAASRYGRSGRSRRRRSVAAQSMSVGPIDRVVDEVFRREAGRVLATLIRLLGDFDLAEEARQEAFTAAIEQWESAGVPANPRAWLIRAGQNKAVDRIRREVVFRTKILDREIASAEADAEAVSDDEDDNTFGDDRLRLIFTCCHPALSAEAHVALTLREVCGLTTQAVARAFLVSEETMAQRLVRAKKKIRDAGIPYETPEPPLFNQRIRGVLALMLLHDARRPARVSQDGDVILLEDQDRTLWDQAKIAEGLALVDRALSTPGPLSPYAVQAAIAALHVRARKKEDTDWPQIVGLYEVLLRLQPSPVIELNHAVAVSMVDGAARALDLVDSLK